MQNFLASAALSLIGLGHARFRSPTSAILHMLLSSTNFGFYIDDQESFQEIKEVVMNTVNR